MSEIHCLHFSGYKPCFLNEECNEACPKKMIPHPRILVVHLEALGAVLRSTSLLPAIKRKYPKSHITWVTHASAEKLLKNNPLIDTVLCTETSDLLKLSVLKFHIGYGVDKGIEAEGVFQTTQCEQRYGFQFAGESNSIIPSTQAANELWELGLSNHKKFFENKKSETQLLVEALELGPFQRDPYVLLLSEKEKQLSQTRRNMWLQGRSVLVGINTGCNVTLPHKKMSMGLHSQLIEELEKLPQVSLVLLGGGEEDSARNGSLCEKHQWVVNSPSREGLRDGLVSVNACDIVISGDSLGMHMAIALKKWVVAWFGPSCAHEIDLYDRGLKILAPVPCAPCWKRSCDREVKCSEVVPLKPILNAVKDYCKSHHAATKVAPSKAKGPKENEEYASTLWA